MGVGLLIIDFGSVLNVKAQEIGQFTSRIDLGLENGFRLLDHCSSVNSVAVGTSH